MPNIEHRLRRVEEALIEAEKAEAIVVRWIIVSPPPRDAAGKIIGPAPTPCLYEWPEARS